MKEEYDQLIKTSPREGEGREAFDAWLDANLGRLKELERLILENQQCCG